MNDHTPLPAIASADDGATAKPAEVDLAPIDFERIEILAPEVQPSPQPQRGRATHRRTVDATGISAPLALLRLRQVVLELEYGDEVLFLADCPGIDIDLAAFAPVASARVAPADSENTYLVTRS